LSGLLVLNIAELVPSLSQLLYLLVYDFNSKEIFIVLHDLDVAVLIVHVEAVFAVLDQIR